MRDIPIQTLRDLHMLNISSLFKPTNFSFSAPDILPCLLILYHLHTPQDRQQYKSNTTP